MQTIPTPQRDDPAAAFMVRGRVALSLVAALALALVAAIVSIPTARAADSNPSSSARPSAAAGPAAIRPALTGDLAAWRVASRLGYAPTPSMLATIRDHPGGARGWASDEIDRAFTASKDAPNIPAALGTFAQPLPTLFAEYRNQLLNRRVNPAPAAGMPGQPSEGGMSFGAMPPAAMRAAPVPAEEPPGFLRRATQEAAAWRLLSCSDTTIENPLLARLTEFWFNHFNVFVGKGTVRPFVGHYVLNAIRPNVLGSFEQLVLASARHPAMLFYLDQAQSVADGTMAPNGRVRGLNENYARELLELHTLGVAGGYTQQDVRELARILTGWTVNNQSPSGFRFAPQLHDRGDKVLLGNPLPFAGENEGLQAIRLLAEHPSTAGRVARRLAQFFVADTPPQALVDRLARTWQTSRGDLRMVMHALIASPEFWDPANSLFKTPYDYACSALSATAAPPSPARIGAALRFLAVSGQPVHGWATPDGYKTDAATWLAAETLTRRADLAFVLARDSNVEPLWLNTFLSERTRERIAMEPVPSRAALALASPEFMRK